MGALTTVNKLLECRRSEKFELIYMQYIAGFVLLKIGNHSLRVIETKTTRKEINSISTDPLKKIKIINMRFEMKPVWGLFWLEV